MKVKKLEVQLSKIAYDHIYGINNLCKELRFPKLYLCGGIVRDIALGLNLTKDYDLTVNDGFKSNMLGLMYGAKNNLMIKYSYNKDIKLIDFEKNIFNFSSGKISLSLRRSNFKNKLKLETLSRDFTINSILLSVEDQKLIDITGRGVVDAQNKIIDTVLDPQITIGDDYKRIFRSMLYSSKYDLTIHDRIIDYIKNNKENIVPNLKDHRSFIVNTVTESLGYNKKKTLSFLLDTNLITSMPLVGGFKNILIKEKLLDFYFKEQDKNTVQENSLIDPIGGFVGSNYPKAWAEGGGPSSVPITFGDNDSSSTYDDNNRIHGSEYRQMPHFV